MARQRSPGDEASFGTDTTLPARPGLALGSSPPHAPSAADGSCLPVVPRQHYDIEGEVGKGGIGRVLAARDGRLGRKVALKELLDADAGIEDRFVREALLTARLQHPSIVPIYEAGRWPSGEPFYSMKLVSGRTLDELIIERHTLRERLSLLPHVLAVAEAVAYAHSERIIHRDLKPSNIIVGAFGETVVIDWGLAKDIAEEENRPSNPDTFTPAGDGLTMVGSIMGTPAYMPPEQAEGLVVDARADVYALGAILYHLLAGVCPYHNTPSLKIISEVLVGPPMPLAQLQSDIPRDLLAIVRKAMARSKEKRYPTAKALADDLRRFQTGQIVSAHEYSVLELLRRNVRKYRAPLAVAATSLVVLLGFGVFAFQENRAERLRAEEKQEQAVVAEEKARRALDKAEQAEWDMARRADSLVLLQARRDLDVDPNRALAWLKTLSVSFDRFGELRLLAADARSRGVVPVLRGHKAIVCESVFSPDGKLLATASDDKTVRIWDLATGFARVLEGHSDEVWSIDFSDDGMRLVSSGKDGSVRLWETDSGEPLDVLRSSGPVDDVVFTKEGGLAGNVFQTGSPWVWTGPGAPIRELGVRSVKTLSSSVSADGSIVAGIDADGEVWFARTLDGERKKLGQASFTGRRIIVDSRGSYIVVPSLDTKGFTVWDLAERKALSTPAGLKNSMVYAFSSDQTLALAATGDGELLLWNMKTDELKRLPVHHDGPLSNAIFSPDNHKVVTGGLDRTVQIYDIETGDLRVHHGFAEGISDLEFSPDGRTVSAASRDGTTRLFHLDVFDVRTLHRGGKAGSVVFSADGRVVSLDVTGVLRSYDVATGKGFAVKALNEGIAFPLVASPLGGLVAVAADVPVSSIATVSEGTTKQGTGISLWDRDGALVHTLSVDAPVRHVNFSMNGARLVAAQRDGVVSLFDVVNGQMEQALCRHEGVVDSVVFSPDGLLVASAGRDGSVRISNVDTGESRVITRHTDGARRVLFSPDGTLVASGGQDHQIVLVNLATGESFALGIGAPVLLLAFSPDGSKLVGVGDGDTIMRVWDIKTRLALAPLRGHDAAVRDFSFSADGRKLVSSSADGTLRIWDLESAESRVLRGHQGDILSADISPDGQWIVSSSLDGTVRLWSDDLPYDGAGLRAWIEAATPDVATQRSAGP